MKTFCLLLTLLLLAHVNSFIVNASPIRSKIRNHHKGKRLEAAPIPAVLASAAVTPSTSSIAKIAIKSVATLLCNCGFGIGATATGLLDQAALGVFSKMAFNLFYPCLLFTNIATVIRRITLSGEKNLAIFLLPAIGAARCIIYYLFARVSAKVLYRGDEESDEAKGFKSCTTFSNAGPLPMVFVAGLFRNHPNPKLMELAIAYISLYLLGTGPFFWTVAPAILEKKEGAPKKTSGMALLNRILSPPVKASLAGLVVGAVPFLRDFLMNPDGITAPLIDSMRTIGTGYLPAVLLILSGSLAKAVLNPAPIPQPAAGDHTKKNVFAKQVLSVMACKMILLPTFEFMLLSYLQKTVPFIANALKQDPMLHFIILLEACMPSAQNVTLITQLQDQKDFSGRLAKLLLFSYVFGIPFVCYWLTRALSATALF